ncbi:MAG: hypothetical protein HC942_26940 [Microcoleus sp. SU_5_6]|nr:hypothetical protein [Microcoleus sp. SU_5_6]
MKVKPSIFTGEYLRSPSREKPPVNLVEAMGMPVPPALLSSANQQKVT